MAGAWISAWSATSLSRVPAYPFRLSTCAAASRIRSLVRADLELASSAASTSCFLGTHQIIGSRPSPTRRGRPPCLAPAPHPQEIFLFPIKYLPSSNYAERAPRANLARYLARHTSPALG